MAGKTEARMPQVDKKDSGEMVFSSSPHGEKEATNGLDKPLPPNQWKGVEPSHVGPLGPWAGLHFGLSLSPRVTAFTDLV